MGFRFQLDVMIFNLPLCYPLSKLMYWSPFQATDTESQKVFFPTSFQELLENLGVCECYVPWQHFLSHLWLTYTLWYDCIACQKWIIRKLKYFCLWGEVVEDPPLGVSSESQDYTTMWVLSGIGITTQLAQNKFKFKYFWRATRHGCTTQYK